MKITEEVYEQIRDSIGAKSPETGGLLGGDRETGIVTHFLFDEWAATTAVTYSPDTSVLNHVLSEWNEQGIRLMGFVHSHPGSMGYPSVGDRIYAARILNAIPSLPYLLLPIVLPETATDDCEFNAYAALRDDNDARIVTISKEIVMSTEFTTSECETENESLESVEVPQQENRVSVPETFCMYETLPEDRLLNNKAWAALQKEYSKQEKREWTDMGETFARVNTAYDIPHLAACRVVIVGTGGAAQFAESVVRTGIGEVVLIDPDVVTESNLGTQQVYRKDLGRPKVEVLAERLQDINPNLKVEMYQKGLEEIEEDELRKLLREPIRSEYRLGPDGKAQSRPLFPRTTLLCGFTDQFAAQAQINRLAIKYQVPSLCAQVHMAGMAAEVTFTHPKLTKACHRCMLASRYRAYEEQDFENTVTSDATPVFATERLNSIKGMIAMALLHAGVEHPRWSAVMDEIADRNLVLIRMAPASANSAEMPVFSRVFAEADQSRLAFDETIWLPQKPETGEGGNPRCIDCQQQIE